MACYEPIIAWEIKGATTETGKKIITFQEPTPTTPAEIIYLPCGKCIGCRLDYSRMWMARISKEASLYPNNAFLTLTYNPKNLPIKETINTETGELITGNPLVKKHVQQFIKKLRREYEYHFNKKGIRYYACGEYGGRTRRPHYHIALFNTDTTAFGDIKVIGTNQQGDALYTSEKIEKIWGKGFITIGDLTPQSAAYIARYMLKKQKGDGKEWYYESQGIISEYTTMSVKPGIARTWYEKHKEEYWLSDRIVISQRNKKPTTVKTPEYFDKLLEQEDPERLKSIKQQRQERLQKAKRLKQSKTTMTEWEQLKIEQKAKEDAAKKLTRPLD